MRRVGGWLGVAAGAALAVPQVFMVAPVPLVFMVGVAVALFGGLAVADAGVAR